MNAVSRKDAIAAIVEPEFRRLSVEERRSRIEDFVCIDEDDEEWWMIPEETQRLLKASCEPMLVADPEDERWDPLLRIALAYAYRGTKGGYIARRFFELSGETVDVPDDTVVLFPCPCCEYHTLDERGEYDICPVCFWEDPGTDNPDAYTSCNRMTLREGRENFRRLGAVSAGSERFLVKDRKERYFHR